MQQAAEQSEDTVRLHLCQKPVVNSSVSPILSRNRLCPLVHQKSPFDFFPPPPCQFFGHFLASQLSPSLAASWMEYTLANPEFS